MQPAVPGVILPPAQPVPLGMPLDGAPVAAQAAPVPGPPAPPNSLLFVEQLPLETTALMLQMLFQQFPGFKEVRMVDAKPGIAFVEFADEMSATVGLQGLQGFKISPNAPMVISYARR